MLDVLTEKRVEDVKVPAFSNKTSGFKRVSSDLSLTELSGNTDCFTACSFDDVRPSLTTFTHDLQTREVFKAPGSTAKIGTLQAFCASEGPIENFSPDLFACDEIHKIAILDMRILNLDRNPCNILVSKTEDNDWKLTPIDHGLSIPDTLEVSSYELAWLSFDQAEKRFSQKSLDFIAAIDVENDIELLEQNLSFRPICLRNMRISTTLLKLGAEQGLTLAQIGEIMCRGDFDEDSPSLLE